VAGTAVQRRAAAGVEASATEPSTPGAGTPSTTKSRKGKGDGYSTDECQSMLRVRRELHLRLPSSSGAGCLVVGDFFVIVRLAAYASLVASTSLTGLEKLREMYHPREKPLRDVAAKDVVLTEVVQETDGSGKVVMGEDGKPKQVTRTLRYTRPGFQVYPSDVELGEKLKTMRGRFSVFQDTTIKPEEVIAVIRTHQNVIYSAPDQQGDATFEPLFKGASLMRNDETSMLCFMFDAFKSHAAFAKRASPLFCSFAFCFDCSDNFVLLFCCVHAVLKFARLPAVIYGRWPDSAVGKHDTARKRNGRSWLSTVATQTLLQNAKGWMKESKRLQKLGKLKEPTREPKRREGASAKQRRARAAAGKARRVRTSKKRKPQPDSDGDESLDSNLLEEDSEEEEKGQRKGRGARRQVGTSADKNFAVRFTQEGGGYHWRKEPLPKGRTAPRARARSRRHRKPASSDDSSDQPISKERQVSIH